MGLWHFSPAAPQACLNQLGYLQQLSIVFSTSCTKSCLPFKTPEKWYCYSCVFHQGWSVKIPHEKQSRTLPSLDMRVESVLKASTSCSLSGED